MKIAFDRLPTKFRQATVVEQREPSYSERRFVFRWNNKPRFRNPFPRTRWRREFRTQNDQFVFNAVVERFVILVDVKES